MGQPDETQRLYTCWCDSGDCSKPTPVAFGLCSECSQFGHLPAPRYGLSADDLWPQAAAESARSAP